MDLPQQCVRELPISPVVIPGRDEVARPESIITKG